MSYGKRERWIIDGAIIGAPDLEVECALDSVRHSVDEIVDRLPSSAVAVVDGLQTTHTRRMTELACELKSRRR